MHIRLTRREHGHQAGYLRDTTPATHLKTSTELSITYVSSCIIMITVISYVFVLVRRDVIWWSDEVPAPLQLACSLPPLNRIIGMWYHY